MTVTVQPETAVLRAVEATPWYQGRLGLLGARLAVGVLLIAVWAIAAHLRLLPPEILPAPLDVLIAIFHLAVDPAFWLSFVVTLRAALISLGLAILIGVPVGLVLGMLPPVERTTRFLMDLARSFPVIALLPVMILLLGVTTEMEITVIVLGVVWPILVQTTYGSRRIDPVIRDTTKSYRISVLLRFFKVVLPAASPFVMTGIRVASSVSILIAIAVEILGRTQGMGFNLANAQIDGASDIAIAYVFYAGALGVSLNALLELVEEKVIVWNARGDRAGGRR